LPLGSGALVDLPVHEVDALIHDCWPCIATTDGGAPENLRSFLRELVEDPCLAPDPIPLGAEPLWPVVCESGEGIEGRNQERKKFHDLDRTLRIAALFPLCNGGTMRPC